MVQLVKNLPGMQETEVRFLGGEDSLEKGKATHSSILAWENSMGCIAHGVAKSQTRLRDFHFIFRTSSGDLTRSQRHRNLLSLRTTLCKDQNIVP